jgi:hypothetical protein
MRNYQRFILASGQIGGAPTSQACTEKDLPFFLANLDAGSLLYQPTEVWFALDKFLFQLWINRTLGNEAYYPNSDGEPVLFLASPRGRGKVTGVWGTITFKH